MRTDFSIKNEKMARSLDTMVDVTNNDPGHIARSKAKVQRIENSRRRAAERAKANDRLQTFICTCLAAFGIWTLAMACLVRL